MLQELFKKFYTNKKVLVTGGAGFIGSRVVATLSSLGANVYVVDDLSTGQIKNIEPLLNKITFFGEDIRNKSFLNELLENKFSVIFHLAAVSSIPRAEFDVSLCYEVNVQAFSNILQLLSAKKYFPIIVFSSSSSVYGEVDKACTENDTLSPVSVYAKSKHEGELLLQQFSIDNNSTAYALRYFNVFSDCLEDGASASVFSIFRDAFFQQKVINIFGTGMQLRDYVPLSKVSEANLLMPLSDTKGFEIFNIASGQSITLFQLLSKLQEELRLPIPPVEFLLERKGDVGVSIADCTKFDSLLRSLNSRFE